MAFNFRNSEEIGVVIIGILSAFLLAAHEVNVGNGIQFISNYAYWFIRILIESILFVAVLYAFEKIIAQNTTHAWVYICAVLISLLAFTLAVTSFDLILGLPELGLEANNKLATPHLQEFGLEVVYLLDNHIVLCAMLLLPRFLLSGIDGKAKVGTSNREMEISELFFDAIDPPLEGHICHIEAQEHYVRIITTHEKRMVLYRFSDAIREMPNTQGMQVHRSHWVAYAAIKKVLKEGQNVKLELTGNHIVPVSRSFRAQVEKKFF